METQVLERLTPTARVPIEVAADYIGVSKTTMYRLMTEPDGIPHVRISPRRIRFRVSDLDAYLERQTRVPGSASPH